MRLTALTETDHAVGGLLVDADRGGDRSVADFEAADVDSLLEHDGSPRASA